MTTRTIVCIAITTAAALWLTRINGVKTAHRKSEIAKRGAYEALFAGRRFPLPSPSNRAHFDVHHPHVPSGNGAYAKRDLSASPKPQKEGKTRSILELAGSVKLPISGVSIEDMNPWRQGPSLARLLRLAQHVWNDSRDASGWMSTPQIELGGKAPIEAAITDSGAEWVEAILWRRIHGVAT